MVLMSPGISDVMSGVGRVIRISGTRARNMLSQSLRPWLSTTVQQREDDGVHICKPFECLNLFNCRPPGRIAIETLGDTSRF